MPDIQLSICIPTYNYGQFIGETIESIRKQYLPGTEIVVLDGGSSDNTREVVERYSAECSYVSYHFQPVKGGIDADLARTVALARGQYCWLLSADDALADGALQHIVTDIESGHDVYLCNRILCDRQLRPQQPQAWLSWTGLDAEIDLADEQQLMQYFGRADSIGALFSFMSTIIVKRDSWNRAEVLPEMFGTNYAHIHRLFSMGSIGGKMKYLAAPLVLCRGDNDSFLSLGLAGRHYIDLCGFRVIAEALYPHSARLRKQFKAVLNREHHWVTWTWLRSVIKDETEWLKIRDQLPHYGYGSAMILAMEWLAWMPKGVSFAHRLRSVSNWILSRSGKR